MLHRMIQKIQRIIGMLDRAATPAACHSMGLVLAILVNQNELSLRELVLCFLLCKAFRELLESRGFCIGTAWLCAYLESGRSPAEILSRLKGHSGSVRCVAWSPDGKQVASGSGDTTVRIWDVSTGKEVMGPLTGHSDSVMSVAWSPCGKFVASWSDDCMVKIWDLETGKEKCLATFGPWSPDGKLVASGSDDNIARNWNVATGKEVMAPVIGLCVSWVDVVLEIRVPREQVGQASQDLMACTGTYMVTADQGSVLICKVLEGRESGVQQETEPVALFRCPSKVHAVACTPPYICAGCAGGQVRVLDAPFICEGPGI